MKVSHLFRRFNSVSRRGGTPPPPIFRCTANLTAQRLLCVASRGLTLTPQRVAKEASQPLSQRTPGHPGLGRVIDGLGPADVVGAVWSPEAAPRRDRNLVETGVRMGVAAVVVISWLNWTPCKQTGVLTRRTSNRVQVWCFRPAAYLQRGGAPSEM